METSPQQKSSWKHSLQNFWQDYGWFIILVVWLIALALGYIGFVKHAAANNINRSALSTLYLTLQLIPTESGAVDGVVSWELEIARFLIPTIAAFAAVRAFTVVFRQQVQLFRLHFISDHLIICGLGQKGFLLVDHFRALNEKIVVIEQDEDNNLIPLVQERGVVVLIGDATDEALLQKAAAQRAKYILAVSGDDGINTEIAVRAQELSRQRSEGVLTCIIHIVDPQLRDLLREQELGTAQASTFRLQIFNIFDHGARLMLQQYATFDAPDHVPHLLVIGLGHLGESVVAHAARMWQEHHPTGDKRVRITAVDWKATWEIESLYVRYPQLNTYCELIPQEMDIHSPQFQRAEFLLNGKSSIAVDTVYICMDDDSKGLHTGLTLLRQMRSSSTPIIIRMTENTGLATLLRYEYGHNSTFKQMYAFSLLTQTCTPEMVLGGTHEVLARALHEEYVYHQKQLGQTAETNPAVVPWDDLSEELKESNRRQVDAIRAKLDAIGAGYTALTGWEAQPFDFTRQEVELIAKLEHERWISERLQEGWSYAPGPKNTNKKNHPDLIAWEKLPEESKEWNRNSVRELPKFLAKAGFQVYRVE